MADLFARLAARANESLRLTVSPRLPARFEGTKAAPDDDDGRGQSDVEYPDSGRDRAGWIESPHGFTAGAAPAGRAAMSDRQTSDEAAPGSVRAREMVRPAQTGPVIAPGTDRVGDDGSEPGALPQIHAREEPIQYGRGDDREPLVPMPTVELAASRIRPVLVGAADLVPPNDSVPKPETRQPAKPDVHISIGRIEVRAAPAGVAPAPMAQAAIPEESGLSLAAYLRGDDGKPR